MYYEADFIDILLLPSLDDFFEPIMIISRLLMFLFSCTFLFCNYNSSSFQINMLKLTNKHDSAGCYLRVNYIFIFLGHTVSKLYKISP